MVNLVSSLTYAVESYLSKVCGLRPQTVEIEPGTVIRFWSPSRDDSKTKKPVLLLLHGFGATAELMWIFQISAFSRQFSVFVPDLLFFGGSVSQDPDRSAARQAQCLARALRAVGVGRVAALVGCSYGGFVGAHMARDSAAGVVVEKLVLSNSNVAVRESDCTEALRRVGVGSVPELMLPESVPGLRRLLRTVIHKRWWFPGWAYKHFLQVMFECREERTELLNAAVTKDEEFVVPNFSQKVYIISGEEDQIFKLETVKQTKEKLGDKATIYPVKNAGHLVQIERPFLYNRILKKILQDSP